MARYTITGTRDATRRDIAANRFYQAVYDEIKANAGLDTQWGHNAARAASVIMADVERGVAVGYGRSVDVGPYRDTVTIKRIA